MGSRIRRALGVVALLAPLGAGAAQESNFGRAMAGNATELLVGQPVNWYGPGTVYAYRLDGSGRLREQARITAPDTARMDDFGRAIALDGNTLAVGAPRKRNGTGVTYVLTRASARAAWRHAAVLEAPSPGQFGNALALQGDDLLIGAPGDSAGGAVHHYRRQGDAWRLANTIRPGDAAGLAGFGGALSLGAEWLLVGAATADSGAGRAYLVRRLPDGTWGTPTRVLVPRTQAPGGMRLGTSVLLAGGHAYLGATGAAAVYVVSRDSADRWTPSVELRPFDAPRGSQFGFAVAEVGDEIWVGAPGAGGGNGAVYRFLATPDRVWLGAMKLVADSADGTHWPFAFGHTITAAAGRAAVAMPQRDFGEGRVMVASEGAAGWQVRQLLEGTIHAIGGGTTPAAQCQDGNIAAYTCSNIELVGHLPTSALGGERGAWVNDVWGWTDPVTNRDIALVARRDGTSFVDVTNPAAPRLLGNLPRTAGSPPSVWRDIKVLAHHAYIVADGAGQHGMQVFDLTRLRTARGTPTFAPDTTYPGVASAHNVVADTASGFVYIVGANGGGETCGGGLHMVNVRNPKQPVFAGCFHSPGANGSRGYTHDAQCVVYRGPDTRYHGRQVCVGSNEREINIADVSDKDAPRVIGRNAYPNVSYAHQGWFDDEQRYFYMNDEGDELDGVVAGTRTIVWDLTRLDDPVVAHQYIGPVMSSDHNLFVVGNRVYESNYGSGLRVLDISERTRPREVAYFDSAPFNDNGPGHSAAQSGAWSNYPFFKSGVVVFTSVREGLFLVRVREPVP